MTKPPHTGTKQPGSHPLPAVPGISSFFPDQVSFVMAPSCLFLYLPPRLGRAGFGWLWMYFHPVSALKVSVGCPLHSWRGQEHPWHWAEQEAPTLRQILAELGLAAGTSVSCPLCSGNTGSCRSPWKVPWQQTPIPSLFLSPTMPRGTAEGSGYSKLSLFLNLPLHYL